jgi:hypothetical protein
MAEQQIDLLPFIKAEVLSGTASQGYRAAFI